MRTLYLRNVPNEVAKRLKRLATQAGLPLSVFAVRELTEASDQLAGEATNVALAETLECPLQTSDRRLARAVGPRCLIQLVPE